METAKFDSSANCSRSKRRLILQQNFESLKMAFAVGGRCFDQMTTAHSNYLYDKWKQFARSSRTLTHTVKASMGVVGPHAMDWANAFAGQDIGPLDFGVAHKRVQEIGRRLKDVLLDPLIDQRTSPLMREACNFVNTAT